MHVLGIRYLNVKYFAKIIEFNIHHFEDDCIEETQFLTRPTLAFNEYSFAREYCTECFRVFIEVSER